MTKDNVLAILKASSGYVSGEAISKKLNLSRSAVNVAVKSLRADGYNIMSSTNKGYLLASSPDSINYAELLCRVGEARMRSVSCFDSVASTNTCLRELASSNAPQGSIAIADKQTQGRGRLGRSFHSPQGKGIYLSYLMRPDMAPVDASNITAWTAVAVRQAIKNCCGVSADIKWVNDLQFNGRKLCGVLTEMSFEAESRKVQYIVIGIGINVNEAEEDFPPELRGIATSLAMEKVLPQSRAALAAELIRQMDALAKDFPHKKAEYFAAYEQAEIMHNRKLNVIKGNIVEPATGIGLNDDFTLKVSLESGEAVSLNSGEVSVRKAD